MFYHCGRFHPARRPVFYPARAINPALNECSSPCCVLPPATTHRHRSPPPLLRCVPDPVPLPHTGLFVLYRCAHSCCCTPIAAPAIPFRSCVIASLLQKHPVAGHPRCFTARIVISTWALTHQCGACSNIILCVGCTLLCNNYKLYFVY